MTAVTIYIAPPATSRGRWRVRLAGRPEVEQPDKASAVAFARDHARMIGKAGGNVVVKIERPDGCWDTLLSA
ncbi:hypothetical protein [Luteibacter rhizovicinus]|uniref:hypothetical protein n=1 Tax=Luteibacter rhizovicinus TaxID=242606 RepID=UPI000A4DC8D1|nr:hypothetical protein [Luteibacter rhizovicinus]